MQWRYIAGNNWGMCEDGTGAVGCGAQEEFRACSDITIGDLGSKPPLRPVRPGTRPTTTKPTNSTTVPPSTETTSETDEQEQGPRYLGPIIAILALLIVLCALAAVYLYHYHGQRIKHIMQWKREQKTQQTLSFPSAIESNQYHLTPPSVPPPVPPPRTKRLSQTCQQDEVARVLNEGSHRNESSS